MSVQTRTFDEPAVSEVQLPQLGVSVHPLTTEQIVDQILDTLDAKESLWIANHNLHSVFLCNNNDAFNERYETESDLRVIDGWPVLVAARLATGKRLAPEHRVGSTDWLAELLHRNENLNVVAVGGTARAAQRAAANIETNYPAVTWHAFDGFALHKQDNLTERVSVEDTITPGSLVLVGMGMPSQEEWILEHRELLDGCVVANVGGCIDYIASEQDLAPRWMGSMGVEWLYRLGRDPRRLWYRYLVEPLHLSALIARNRWRCRRGEVSAANG